MKKNSCKQSTKRINLILMISICIAVFAQGILPAGAASKPLSTVSSLDELPELPLDPVSIPDILAGKSVYLVLVKDFMRITNSGPAAGDVTFKRYFPLADREQIVAGRWLTARADSGREVSVRVDAVEMDSAGNPVHSFLIPAFPGEDEVVVTATSLVIRRERPIPQRSYPILEREAYPPEIRPFLDTTVLVPSDHPEIKAKAAELLEKSQDIYEIASILAAFMKGKPYDGFKKWDQGEPTAVNVLRHGGSCCSSANCAAAVFRACGIPAQATYTPAGYFHGIVQFYLNGFGWVRMDSTCSRGDLPLIQDERGLGLIRIFDMPIEMEAVPGSFAWPYYNTDDQGRYRFFSKGEVTDKIFFARKIKKAEKPFTHYESGSWNKLLGSETFEKGWKRWDHLVKLSLKSIEGEVMGVFPEISALLPGLSRYIDAAAKFGY